jgi:hypothetical protein
MSLSTAQLNLRRVVDPRTDVNSAARRTYNIFNGGTSQGYVRVQPNGGVSSSQMSFTLNPPSPDVFWDRRVQVEVTYDISFTGSSIGPGITLLQAAGAATSPGVSAGTANYDAPRCQPLNNSLSTIQVSLNSDRLSQNLNLYSRALTRYANPVQKRDVWSAQSPQMLDQSIEYADLNGTARDPMRPYGDNVFETSRGGFEGVTILTNTDTGAADTATVRLKVTEFLQLSPFLFEAGANDTGLLGIQNASLTLTLGGRGVGPLSGLAGSIWSHSKLGSVLTGAIASVVEAQCIVSYISPDPTMSIPKANSYPYSELTYYPTTSLAAVPAAVPVTLAQNNVQLDSIPSRVYFWISAQDSDFNMTETDTFFNISNINVSFHNRDAILSNATEADLYAIAAKNGSNLSFTQWNKRVGSVLALDFGEDIPLAAGEAVGMAGNFNFHAKVTCTNLRAGAVVPTLSMLVVQDGVMSIENNRVVRSVGILSKEDVIRSKDMPATPYRASGSIYGGGFFDDIGRFLKGIARPAIEAAKSIVPLIAPEFAPAVGIADQLARSQGLGLVGGRRMSRAQMLKQLRA